MSLASVKLTPPAPAGAVGVGVVTRRLAQGLFAAGQVGQAQLDELFRRAAGPELRPGWPLVEARLMSEADWVDRVAAHFGLASAHVSDFTIDRALVGKVPEELARRHQLLPLTNAGREIYVAIADPTQLTAFDQLAKLVGAPVITVVVPPSELEQAFERYYLREQVDFEHVGADDGDLSAAELARLREEGESGKAVQLVDRLLAHAIASGASDIHIETTPQHLRIRFRVDGALREGPRYPAIVSPLVVSRVKVLAQLDISERWVPQDGRVRIRRGGSDLDLRVSVVPVARGEKVVIRILSAGRERSSLEALGLPDDLVATLLTEVHRPHGMMLVTGPTGSGKTSTLYGLLGRRATIDTNVVTVEDPIEYESEALNQIPINPRRGITFATALRAILRQDPDVILVGEIRDQETALIAAEAALTGHLLLSTLHTNDAAGAVLRLVEMGVPRYLVGAVTNAVVAQRLIRRVCTGCAEEYAPAAAELRALGVGELAGDPRIRLVRGRGCARCEGTGLRGRMPIAELLVVDDAIRQALYDGASTTALQELAIARGMIDLRRQALRRLFAGETTTAEVTRVASASATPSGEA
ncbi:MAG TPA: GspE/PulE family protein [Kofleriaceae bacterium]|nr:GspE/PulE family protein [Kofleriaceae bacterium]